MLVTDGREDSLGTAKYFEYVEYALDIQGKSFSSVLSIIDDDTATSEVFACRVGRFLLGYNSHRYNLAGKNILAGYSDVTLKVQDNKKLKYQILVAEL